MDVHYVLTLRGRKKDISQSGKKELSEKGKKKERGKTCKKNLDTADLCARHRRQEQTLMGPAGVPKW